MRCVACNKRLNDRESVRKSATTGQYLDLCNHCFSFVAEDIPDVEEGDFPSEYTEDGEEHSDGDYQQYIGENCNDCETDL